MSAEFLAFLEETLATADRYAYDSNTDPGTKQLLLDLITVIVQLMPTEEDIPL